MAATLSALETAKDIYKPAYDSLNQDYWLLAQLEKNTDRVSGQRAIHNVHTRRTSGIGAIGESSTLPTAGNQGYRKLYVPLRMLAGRVEISLATMRLLTSNDASFVDHVDAEIQGNKNDLMFDVARQVWGTSNGVIATCGTTSSSTTVVLATTTTSVQLRHLWNDGGMVIDIGTVASPQTVASARTVTSVNETAKTLVISGAAVSTTDGTHFIFRTGNGGASSNSGLFGDGQYELTGMQTAFSDTATLHTLAVATEPQWKANVYGNSGTARDVTEPLITNALMNASIKTGKVPEFLACSEEVLSAISLLFLQMKRNMMPDVQLKGGYQGISWTTPGINSKPGANVSAIVADMHAPAGGLYGFSSDSFVFYVTSEGFEWMDADGAMWSRVANKPSYEASIVGFAEVATTIRRDLVLISDLAGVTA